ncbi:hypothetical protein F7R23_32300 [Burkholderia diffusa]|nr:hypothetical protein F7R23_32300 [Burkholderia diffusa]
MPAPRTCAGPQSTPGNGLPFVRRGPGIRTRAPRPPRRHRPFPCDHLAFSAFCLVFLVTSFSQISA